MYFNKSYNKMARTYFKRQIVVQIVVNYFWRSSFLTKFIKIVTPSKLSFVNLALKESQLLMNFVKNELLQK